MLVLFRITSLRSGPKDGLLSLCGKLRRNQQIVSYRGVNFIWGSSNSEILLYFLTRMKKNYCLITPCLGWCSIISSNHANVPGDLSLGIFHKKKKKCFLPRLVFHWYEVNRQRKWKHLALKEPYFLVGFVCQAS